MLNKKINKKFVKGIRNQIAKKFYKFDTVNKRGYYLLNDPTMNKTCGFSKYEIDHLRIRGFLPDKILTIEQQMDKVMEEYNHGIIQLAQMYPDPETTQIGITPDMIRKNRALQTLQELDVTLYYNIIRSDFQEFLPIVYTPTVAWVCKNFSLLYRRSRGVYISIKDKGNIASIFSSIPLKVIRVINITDGSKVMSIGDQGIGGMSIVVARKDIYVAAGGFNPWKVLPLTVDVGTNNQKLLDDPQYLGIQEKRVNKKEYFELFDEIMENIRQFYPYCITVFEDFQVEYGLSLIYRYRNKQLVYNECISGTASTILAGVLSGLKIQKMNFQDITKLKFFVVGAGNVGMGIVYNLSLLLQQYGLTQNEINEKFYLFDIDGFITTKRQNLTQRVYKFASLNEEDEGKSLEEIIQKNKPHVLIGCSGQKGVFNNKVLSNLNNEDNIIPMIFALSNPTSKSECTAQEAYRYTNNNVIFASGSPFEDLQIEDKVYRANQAHNSYIGPGYAKGCTFCQIQKSDDSLIIAAAEGLANLTSSASTDRQRSIYPDIKDLEETSMHVATSVVIKANELGCINNPELIEFFKKERTYDEVKELVTQQRWTPEYRHIINN